MVPRPRCRCRGGEGRGPGAWASDGDEILLAPARPVRAVDPVGAGDAFAAGFISALLDGGDLRAALDSATVVAASAVQFAGDTAGLPSRAERDALLRDDPGTCG